MASVSIVLTSYNHDKFLRTAINSVVNQTFGDWEMFIWDDISSDDSWSVIQSYADPRITAIRNDKKRRYLYAINKTITELGSGKYVAIHHSDDAWEPDKLTQQVEYLDTNPDKAAVFTHVQYINEHDQHIDDDWFNVPNQSRFNWLRSLFFNSNRFCHPSVLVRRDSLIGAGLYKLAHGQIDDAEMWTRLLLRHEVHVIPSKLTLHRKFSDGRNVSAPSKPAAARLKFEWFEQKKNYIGLSCPEILGIFPESEQWLRQDIEGEPDFLLAMVAIKLGNSQGTRLFGLDLLYQLLSNPERASRVYESHRFDYLDFLKISGEQEIFLGTDVYSRVLASLASMILSLRIKLDRVVKR